MSRLARAQRGLSLLEFTLAVLIVSVLTVMAFERIAATQAAMERAEVRHTVGAMRTALALELADLAVSGRLRDAHRYDGANALALLSPEPAGYRGERESLPAPGIEPGSWYYVAASGLVVYEPRFPDAFAGEAGTGGQRLYWRAVARGAAARDEAGAPRGPVQALALQRVAADGRRLRGGE